MQKFDDNKNIRTYKDSVIIGRLLRYARPVIWYFVLALFLTAILVAVDMLPAFLQGELIGTLQDSNITNNDKMSFAVFLLIIYLVVIIT